MRCEFFVDDEFGNERLCEREATWLVCRYDDREARFFACEYCTEQLSPKHWQVLDAVEDGPEERPEPLSFANTGCRRI